MTGADIKVVQGGLVALVLALAIGGGAVYYTDAKLKAARVARAAAQSKLAAARNRLHQSGDEKATIEKYLGDYQTLQQLGFVGDEQRINWLEGLRVANQQLRLFGVDYQISAQQAYPYAAALNPGQMAMYQSVMKIDLGLLHEGDLLSFLSNLSQQGAGVFSVNQCTISRVNTVGGLRFQPNLHAQCDLAWITARAPAGAKS